MPDYYFEYARPKKKNKRLTDPDNYEVVRDGKQFAMNNTHADRVIKSQIADAYSDYETDNIGVIMFKRDNNAPFTDDEWNDKLEDTFQKPEHIMQIKLDC